MLRRLQPIRSFQTSPRLLQVSCALSIRAYAAQDAQDRDNPGGDDYYALLLEQPMQNAASPSILPQESGAHLSQSQPILFSQPSKGPSAREHGHSRGEQGLSKPAEPDNCCMSGCVNCVWDTYREEMEEWVQGRRKRESMLHNGSDQTHAQSHGPPATSGKEDHMSSLGSNTDTETEVDDQIFQGVPVGIREFMKQEKRLRGKRERTQGQAT